MAQCICDALRACEDRVARGERARIALEIDTLMRRVTRHPNGKPESGYFEGVDDVLGILLTRVDGRNRTLNAAIMEHIEASYGSVVVPVQIIPGLVAALQENYRMYQESYGPAKGPMH